MVIVNVNIDNAIDVAFLFVRSFVHRMVFHKFRPNKQWGRMDTRLFKQIFEARNKRKMPSFRISDSVKSSNIEICDPRSDDFPFGQQQSTFHIDHPAFLHKTIEDHPLYNKTKCVLFDGTEAFTDGIDQACALTNAIRRNGFPSKILEKASSISLPNNLEDRLCDAILHGERYDPTLEKLPKRFDPVLFWIYHPRKYGTPILTRSNIILDNLYRSVVMNAILYGQLDYLRMDRDEPLSGIIRISDRFDGRPFVIRNQPHLIIQSPSPIQPWADEEEVNKTKEEDVVDIKPIDAQIDLTDDHLYNLDVIVPRNRFGLHLDTIMWAREQHQKYPWTREQNAANAIMYCFGASLIEATRYNNNNNNKLTSSSSSNILKKPIMIRGVQLVNGRIDLVVFQLNTLDLTHKSSAIKNIVWIEPALQLYKPGPFDEDYNTVQDLHTEPYKLLTGLLLTR